MRHGYLAVVLCAVTAIAATATTPYIVIQKRIATTPATVAHFPATLSPVAPADVDVPAMRKLTGEGRIQDAQRLFDILAWQKFIELGWPADPSGTPRRSLTDPGGMHIAMLAPSSPEWIWTTFEQVDNLAPRDAATLAGGKSVPVRASFHNASLKGVPQNVLPPRNAVTGPDGRPTIDFDYATTAPTTWMEKYTTTPVQVVRVIPLDQPTIDLNDEVRAILRKAGSKLQYYELIGTQWPQNPNAPAFAGGADSAPESIIHKTPGNMTPVFLTNSTMETYFQLGVQPAGPLEQNDRLAAGSPPIDSTLVFGTESCVGCHYSAGITIGFRTDPRTGARTPIYGENTHFGRTGSAHFSWMLQQEPQSTQAPAAKQGNRP